MQVPILNGIYTDELSDFRTSYPRNLIPVPKISGISSGYLRPSDGIEQFAVGVGVDRGGINWDGVCYRVSGDKLITVNSDGTITELGEVEYPINVQASFDYSFDRLAIAASGKLFYWSSSLGFTQVVDTDLGYNIFDVLWVDGYFMVTDGEFIIVTDLTDPTSVNPLKYGSSETDPDPIKALLKIRNEPYVLNRYTIEVFDNVGGSGFPFQRIEGAQIKRGTVGTFACCVFMNDRIAFLGGNRNEPVSVWAGANGTSGKIATREIDQILLGYSEAVLSTTIVESIINNGSEQLYIHLPDQTLVYDATASQQLEESVWFILTTSLVGVGQYRAQNHVWCYDKWIVGDPITANIGTLSKSISSHWGVVNGWDFNTLVIYNEGKGAVIHELELIGLPGRGELNDDSTISASYSVDGESWGQEKLISVGSQGSRTARMVWFQQGYMNNYRLQRFSGTSESRLSIARLEMKIEGLNL